MIWCHAPREDGPPTRAGFGGSCSRSQATRARRRLRSLGRPVLQFYVPPDLVRQARCARGGGGVSGARRHAIAGDQQRAIARWFLAVAQTHRDRDDGCGLRDPDWKSLPPDEAQQEFRARFNRWALLGTLADLLALSRVATDEKLLLDGLASVSSEEAKSIVVRALQGGALHNSSLFEQAPKTRPPSTETVEQMCRDFPRHAAGLYRGPLDVMGDQRVRPGFVGWHRDSSPVSWGPMRQLAELVLRAGAEQSHAVLSPLLALPEPAFGILCALMNRPDIARTPVWLTTLVPLAAGAFAAEKTQRWSVMRLALNTLGTSPAAWVNVVAMATEAWPRDEALRKLAQIASAEVLPVIREVLAGPLAAQPKGLAASRLRRLERTLTAADRPRVALKYKVQGSVGTDGGPVIAIPKEAVAAWEGANHPSKESQGRGEQSLRRVRPCDGLRPRVRRREGRATTGWRPNRHRARTPELRVGADEG